jgi:toxin ParE1/3/4
VNRYRVVFTSRAKSQIQNIWDWLAEQASDGVAGQFTARLLERCQSLGSFPHRGTPRDEIRSGLRTIPFRRMVTIGYVIFGADVVIVALAYRGQDLASVIDRRP